MDLNGTGLGSTKHEIAINMNSNSPQMVRTTLTIRFINITAMNMSQLVVSPVI